MRRIDAHQHFWIYDPIRDSWMPDHMPMIKKDFLPKDLEPLLKDNDFDGCITIQSEQAEIENVFQLENSKQNSFIKG
jgi:L-fuconolactonase